MKNFQFAQAEGEDIILLISTGLLANLGKTPGFEYITIFGDRLDSSWGYADNLFPGYRLLYTDTKNPKELKAVRELLGWLESTVVATFPSRFLSVEV